MPPNTASMLHPAELRLKVEKGIKNRMTWVMLICIAAAGVILARAVVIQLMVNPRLDLMARRQFQSKTLVRPRRGAIYDRNGEPLAINVETKSLAANPSKITDKRGLARLLARATRLPYQRIYLRLKSNREFVWIKRHLSDSELKRFKKLRLTDADGESADGLWLVNESERVYPHRQLASHTIGSVNVDSEGLEGVELWMNEKLRGQVVSVSAIKDALGRPTFIDTVAAKSVQDGGNVSLTLDASLQFEVEQELNSAIKRTGSKSGIVIVMDASNGEVLAMATEPTFDPNEKATSPEHRRNRALTDGFEPGSTFKAVLLASALANHWHLSDEVWAEKGSLVLQGHKISEAEAKEKFEWLSLEKMIQLSSNVAAAKIALKLGPDRFLKTIRAFGFGARTGLGFPGEISGRIPARKEWSPLTLANIGFGHGVLVTPMQITRAYAAIANGGWLVQPTLVQSENSLAPPVRVLSHSLAHDVTTALLKVTEEGGTGTKASLDGYRVAGKTGTAQMIDLATGRYSHNQFIASFVGFPTELDRKIVIFTSLVEPRGVYYASETAAPLFKEVLGSVVNRCSLPMRMTPPKVLAENLLKDKIHLTEAAPIKPVDLKLLWQEGKEKGDAGWIMPSLKGLTPRESMRVLQGHHFQLGITGSGIVSSQKPEEGMKIAEGDSIRLILAEP